MTLFLEDPKPVIFIGILVLVVLAFLFMRTRRTLLVLLGMVVVVLLTVAGVVIERVVVTDREKIEAALDGIEKALEANDIEALMQYVSPLAHDTENRARSAMNMITITDTRIRNLEIVVNQLTSPPTAEVRFSGVIRFKLRIGEIGRDLYAAKFTVKFRLEDDRWVVTDPVEHETGAL